MNKRFELSWQIFCNEICDDALRKLEKENNNYAKIMSEYSKFNEEINQIIYGNKELTQEHLELMKKYIVLFHQKESFESIAIYSRGICDGLSFFENFK